MKKPLPSSSLEGSKNSDLFSAFSKLNPKQERQRVLVYVEADDDVAFWRSILHPFEKHGIKFEINTPFKENSANGKPQLLKKKGEVGTHLILCMDSDYDYLLQGSTEQSREVIENEFIFQTYTYSIENMRSHSESLHLLCVQATKCDTRLIDFEELMKKYSKIIYPLFLWSVYFETQQDTTSFTRKSFGTVVNISGRINVKKDIETVFDSLQKCVGGKITELEQTFPDKIPFVRDLADTLAPLELNEENVYLFASGHAVEGTVLKFLNSVRDYLENEKTSEIKKNAKHGEAPKNELEAYNNQTKIPIIDLLKNNTEFKSCFLYLKIEEDLNRYIERFKASLASEVKDKTRHSI